MQQGYISTKTVGGISGHLLRRLIHLITLVVPIAYYDYSAAIANPLSLSSPQLVLVLLLIILSFECLRLWLGWTVFGQRQHEKNHISSFTWSAIAIAVVLILVPEPKYAYPVIWSWTIVDPLLGELRFLKLNKFLVMTIGVIVVAIIWLLCSWLFQVPWWLAFIMAPITVAAEWPNLQWIDDNATMQMIPLVFILLLWHLGKI